MSLSSVHLFGGLYGDVPSDVINVYQPPEYNGQFMRGHFIFAVYISGSTLGFSFIPSSLAKVRHGTALSCAFLLGAAPAPNDHRRRRRSGDGDRPARGLVKPCSDGHQEIRVLDDSRCTCRATPKKRRGGLRTARRTVQSVSC